MTAGALAADVAFAAAECACGCQRGQHVYEYARGQLRYTRCRNCRRGGGRCDEFEPNEVLEEPPPAAADLALVPVEPAPAEASPALVDQVVDAIADGRLAGAVPDVETSWDAWLCVPTGRRYGQQFAEHGAPERCFCQLVPVTVWITRGPA